MKKLFVLVCLLAIGFCNVAWAAKRQAKHVVLIALDGWGAYSVPKADRCLAGRQAGKVADG